MKTSRLILAVIALTLSACEYDDAFRAVDSAAATYYGERYRRQQPGYIPPAPYQPTYHY